jgi:hypothetical protein
VKLITVLYLVPISRIVELFLHFSIRLDIHVIKHRDNCLLLAIIPPKWCNLLYRLSLLSCQKILTGFCSVSNTAVALTVLPPTSNSCSRGHVAVHGGSASATVRDARWLCSPAVRIQCSPGATSPCGVAEERQETIPVCEGAHSAVSEFHHTRSRTGRKLNSYFCCSFSVVIG